MTKSPEKVGDNKRKMTSQTEIIPEEPEPKKQNGEKVSFEGRVLAIKMRAKFQFFFNFKKLKRSRPWPTAGSTQNQYEAFLMINYFVKTFRQSRILEKVKESRKLRHSQGRFPNRIFAQ